MIGETCCLCSAHVVSNALLILHVQIYDFLSSLSLKSAAIWSLDMKKMFLKGFFLTLLNLPFSSFVLLSSKSNMGICSLCWE